MDDNNNKAINYIQSKKYKIEKQKEETRSNEYEKECNNNV